MIKRASRVNAVVFLAVSLLAVSLPAAASDVRLTLRTPNGPPIVLDQATLRAHAAETIDVQWKRGEVSEEASFTGVRVRSLLSLLNLPAGSGVRGDWMRYVVTAIGADGYRVSFGLAELEPSLSGRRAIVAWQRDSAELPANASPLQLVIEGDMPPSRSVRQLIELQVIDTASDAIPRRRP